MISHASKVRLAQFDCLTALGDSASTHAALLRGEIGLRPTPVLGQKGGESVPLALLPGHDLDEATPPVWLDAVRKLVEPIKDLGWGSPRRPICFASSNFGVGSLYSYQVTQRPEAIQYGTPEGCVDWLRREMGWGTHLAIFSHACVSSHIALLHASRLVESEAADEVLIFSFDFLSPFVAGGFHALKILNATMPAPYQNRDIGAIGLGDGAAYAVISKSRGEFEIPVQNVHNEMFHFTSNQPAGAGFDALLKPLSHTGLKLWFKGHGTGTLEAGKLESHASAKFFPNAPIVGWKGSLGHTLGSCGLVELALTTRSLQTGITPGTVGSANPTFESQVALTSFNNQSYDGALCTSNAFGGAHAAFLLRHV